MKIKKIKILLSLLTGILLSSIIFAQDKQNANDEKRSAVEMQGNSPMRKDKPDGIVRLKIVLLPSGKIGDITVVSSNTSESFVKQAIEAARNIKFEPAKKNGVSQTATATVEYTFSISSFAENDKELLKNAEILEMPEPEYPKEHLKNIGGKVRLTIDLYANGEIEIVTIKSDLPKKFQDEAAKAALKIKFKPAINKNGKEVTQTKEIEYEFKAQEN